VGQLPHAAFHFFMKDGHAVHGSYEVKNLGKPVSHGCVRISPENATTLYALVEENGLENTQVVLTGVTPGGEFKFARVQADPGWGFFRAIIWHSPLLRLALPLTTDLEVTTDRRRATHGGEGRALACFLNLGPRRLIFITASQMCCRPGEVGRLIHFAGNAVSQSQCRSQGKNKTLGQRSTAAPGTILRSPDKHPIRRIGTTVRTKLKLRNGHVNGNFRPLR
jgi:hypothetical protein